MSGDCALPEQGMPNVGRGAGAAEGNDLRSFEASFAELEALVEKLEGGALTLDDALGHYERGVGALKRCYRILDLAERRLELLVREADGSLSTRACDLAELRGEARGGAKIGPAPVAAAPPSPSRPPSLPAGGDAAGEGGAAPAVDRTTPVGVQASLAGDRVRGGCAGGATANAPKVEDAPQLGSSAPEGAAALRADAQRGSAAQENAGRERTAAPAPRDRAGSGERAAAAVEKTAPQANPALATPPERKPKAPVAAPLGGSLFDGR